MVNSPLPFPGANDNLAARKASHSAREERREAKFGALQMNALALDGARDENLGFVSATSTASKFADVLRLA